MEFRGLLFLAVAVVTLGLIYGQPARAERSLQRDPYGGVVINETVTVAGQDFYQQFVAAWRDRDLSDRFSIVIHERPSARLGSQIWVEAAQRRLFQAFLPTARAAVKTLSEQAVDVAYQQVTEAEVERLLFRDADLGADEL
jgi:curli production assembly/transport component CsgE